MQKIIFLCLFSILGFFAKAQNVDFIDRQLRSAGLLQNQTRATSSTPMATEEYDFVAYHTYASLCWIEGNSASQEFSLIVQITNKTNHVIDSIAATAILSQRITYRDYTQVNVPNGSYNSETGLWKVINLPSGITAILIIRGWFLKPEHNGTPPAVSDINNRIEYEDNSSYNFNVRLDYFHQSAVADNSVSINPTLRFDNKPPDIIRKFPENPVIFKDFSKQYYFERTWGEPQVEGYTEFKIEELTGNQTFDSETGLPTPNGKLVATNTPYSYLYTYKDECQNATVLNLEVRVEKHYPPLIRGPVEDDVKITSIDSSTCTIYYLQPYLEVLDERVTPNVKDTIQLPIGNNNALGTQTCPELSYDSSGNTCFTPTPGYAHWCNTTPNPSNSQGNYSGMPDPNCSHLTQWYYTDHENAKGDLYRRMRWNFKYDMAPKNTQVYYYYKLVVGPWLLANPDRAKTTIGIPTSPIIFLNNDKQCGTSAEVVEVEQPQNGQVTVNNNFTFTYQPNPDFGGLDTFKYTICNLDEPRKCASSYVVVNVTSDYNLSIKKTINTNPIPTSLNDGDLISYKITVNNIGVKPIDDVYVMDTIRNMLTFQSASRNHTVVGPNIYRFDLGRIQPDASVTFTITCKVKDKVAIETYNAAAVLSTAPYYQELSILKSDNHSIAPPVPINSDYDLQINKQLTLTSIEEGKCDSIGQPFAYTLTVKNIGLKDPTNATIIDTLPRGVIFLTGAGSGTFVSNTISDGREIITWKLPAIPKNETVTVIFSVQGIMSGTWVNSAHVRGFEGTKPIIENMTNNVSSATVIVPNALNPYIQKTVRRTLYNLRDQFTYTIKLGNRGKEEGKNIIIRDTLPPQLEYVGKTQYNPNVTLTWDEATRVVTYTLPILKSQMVDSFKIEVRAAAVADNVINRVKLEMEQEIEYPTSQCTLKIVDGFDVGITIEAAPKPAMQGELITYTIKVTNYSARVTTGDVKMTLPQELTYISDSENAFIEPLGELEWRVNRLNIGESKVLTLICRAGEFNDATVTVKVENEKDTELSNNTASVKVLFTTPPINLKLTKSTTQPRTYWLKEDGTPNEISIPITIKIENRGTELARDVIVIDTLPANFTVKSSNPSASGGSIYEGRTILKWNLGSISKTSPYTIELVLSYPRPFGPTFPIDAINRAWVTTTDIDPNLSNNTDTCAFSIVNDIDLWIKKTSDKPIYEQGETITYTLTVESKGRKPSGEYIVKDILPEGFTPQNINQNGTFDENTRTITWNPTGLTHLGSAIFTFNTEATRAGTTVNRALISFDPIPFERQVEHRAYIKSGVKLTTTVEVQSPKRFVIGDKFTITYTVKNNGTYPAKNLKVESQLPTQLFYPNESEVPDKPGLFVNKTDGSLLWNIAEVSVNGEETLILEVQGNAEGENLLIDYLTTTNDGKEQHEFDELQIVAPPYDLTILKTVTDTIVQSDDNVPFTYTITVQNTGTETLDNIVITDTLPNNMAFKNTVQYKGNVTVNNNIVEWNLSELTTFEEQTLELTVVVRDTGKYVNSAEIFSTSPNADEEKNKLNNRSTVTVYAISGLQRWNIMQIFTPNGDGKNDKFVIRELEDPRYSDNEIVIFNRYGSEVFHAKPYNNDWSGGSLKNDTYFYHLRINITGSWVERKGFIQLKK